MHMMVDGVRLAYDVAGSGDTLVLLHGFPLDRTIWDEQREALARRVRVVRIDLRGSGESAGGSGPALMESLAGDVCGVLDGLGVERAILAGHAMGGYVALAFFRMYAERVAGLALVAGGVAADSPARAIERDAQAACARGMAEMADSIVAAVLEPAFTLAHPRTAERLRAIVAAQDADGAAAQIIGMKERLDCADLLEDIAVPALIVAGLSDRLIEPGALERSAAAIADCEFLGLPGVGHLPMLEASAATTAALDRLVTRCALTPGADPHSARATRA